MIDLGYYNEKQKSFIKELLKKNFILGRNIRNLSIGPLT